MTTWRPIPGFPHHEASCHGDVRRSVARKGRLAGSVLKQKIRPNGYAIVSISGRKHFVHRLVCAAFHGSPSAGVEVSHENGQQSDNSPDNLRWRTHAENEAMKVQHGTRVMGEACGAAKLTELSVITIRSVHRLGWHTQAEIANFYNISRATVGDIISRRTWRHAQ